MKVPSSVRILGKEWVIEEKDLKEAYGFCHERSLTIEIQKGLVEKLHKDTLFHEVLHAIDFTVGTKLTEEQVGVLATAILGVFLDNPLLAEYLWKNTNSPKKKR